MRKKNKPKQQKVLALVLSLWVEETDKNISLLRSWIDKVVPKKF